MIKTFDYCNFRVRQKTWVTGSVGDVRLWVRGSTFFGIGQNFLVWVKFFFGLVKLYKKQV